MALIESSLYQGFFALLLYQKRPSSVFIKMTFFALLLYQKQPLSTFIKNRLFRFVVLWLYSKRPLSAFIKKGLFNFLGLSKTAFINDFSFYRFVKNYLYRPLSKTTFNAFMLYYSIKKRPSSAFIDNILFALLLYQKCPLFAFI